MGLLHALTPRPPSIPTCKQASAGAQGSSSRVTSSSGGSSYGSSYGSSPALSLQWHQGQGEPQGGSMPPCSADSVPWSGFAVKGSIEGRGALRQQTAGTPLRGMQGSSVNRRLAQRLSPSRSQQQETGAAEALPIRGCDFASLFGSDTEADSPAPSRGADQPAPPAPAAYAAAASAAAAAVASTATASGRSAALLHLPLQQALAAAPAAASGVGLAAVGGLHTAEQAALDGTPQVGRRQQVSLTA